MAVEAVPIKVLIGLRPNGHADHPDWRNLPLALAGGRPEDHQIVKWRYDKTSGHDEDTVDSPRGQQFGMMMVTQQYADEAVATFPGFVTIMTEVEAQVFWDTKAHAHIAENKEDTDVLVGLKAHRDLLVDTGAPAQDLARLDTQIAKALDPDDLEPGRRKNREKKFVDAKIKFGFTVKLPV